MAYVGKVDNIAKEEHVDQNVRLPDACDCQDGVEHPSVEEYGGVKPHRECLDTLAYVDSSNLGLELFSGVEVFHFVPLHDAREDNWDCQQAKKHDDGDDLVCN